MLTIFGSTTKAAVENVPTLVISPAFFEGFLIAEVLQFGGYIVFSACQPCPPF